MHKWKDPEWVREQYEVNKLSTAQIAEVAGCSKGSMQYRLKKYGINIRSKSESCKLVKHKPPKSTGGKVILNCANCGKVIEKWRYQAENCKEGLFCNTKCVGEYHSKERIGENAANWKGGVWNFRKPILVHTRYRKLRKKVLDRDDNKCTKCGSKTNLNVHHVAQRKDNPGLAMQFENLITVCKPCHIALHKKNI